MVPFASSTSFLANLNRRLIVRYQHGNSLASLSIGPSIHMFKEVCIMSVGHTGLYSKHVPIVPVLVESWSGQVNSGPW